ncbi:MAG TPA: aldo/keto reductase [Chitinophagaceae bacterium]|nr:aldo/keto reductase [Chitinophagaceae bacterium]
MITNKILLGTAQLGLEYGINNRTGKPSPESAIDILKVASENDITYLDTAEAYGNAQEIIGAFHRGSKTMFNVVTKLSEASFHTFSDINKIVEADLDQLNVDCLYAYLFHSIELYRKYFDVSIFSNLKEKKKLLKVGVSIYTNEQALEVSKDKNIDIVQLPYNLLDNMNKRGDVLRMLKQEGKEVHVRSVFLQGVLLMNEDEMPSKLEPLKKYKRQIRHIAEEMKMSVPELALSYVLQNDLIDKILIGVDSLNQLNQHIGFFKSYSMQPFEPLDKINSISVVENEILNPVNW